MKSPANKLKKLLYALMIFIITSVLFTVLLFYRKWYPLTSDGIIHLARYEEVVESFEHFSLPPLVNFIGFGGYGSPFSATYPWISSLIFIFPRLIISNPMHSLFFSLCLLNVLILINTYLCLSKFSKNENVKLLGSLLYDTSTYNIACVFGAQWGEALAIAFLPLVFLGFEFIWNRHRTTDSLMGILFLGFGMGMIINAHVLTVVICCIILIVIETIRLINKNLTFTEVKDIVLSAFLSLATGLYSIVNLLVIYVHNHISGPFKYFGTINLSDSIINALRLDFAGGSKQANLGLVLSCCFFILILNLFKSRQIAWKKWFIASAFLFFLTLSILPYRNFKIQNTFLGILQFTSRLLPFVSLFLVISLVLFCNSLIKDYGGEEHKINLLVIILSIFLMACTTISLAKYYSHPMGIYTIDNSNYYQIVNGDNTGESDYAPIFHKGNKISHFTDYKRTKQTFNSESIEIKQISKNASYTLPFYLFKKIPYQLVVNGESKPINNKTGLLTTTLKRGTNIIRISSHPTVLNYITFITSIFAIVLSGCLLVYYCLRRCFFTIY